MGFEKKKMGSCKCPKVKDSEQIKFADVKKANLPLENWRKLTVNTPKNFRESLNYSNGEEKTTKSKRTYVHDALSVNIRPWFKEHEIEDTPYSALENEAYPPSTQYSNQTIFMVPMVMIVGFFVGRYVYKKFFKELPAKNPRWNKFDKKKKQLQAKE